MLAAFVAALFFAAPLFPLSLFLFPLSLSSSLLLPFSYWGYSHDAFFLFQPTRGESITVLVRSTISLHF